MLIWKGGGIIVPILILLSGWISSYWFEDTRLGNAPFIGLTFLIACLPVLLIGLGLNAPSEDENGNMVKKGHSFFFIPVYIWGIILTGAGIYFYWF